MNSEPKTSLKVALQLEAKTIAVVFLGGSIGAGMRVALDQLSAQADFKALTNFSVGVLVVNLLGVMLLSYLKCYDAARKAELIRSGSAQQAVEIGVKRREDRRKLVMLGITTGMIGAFTTYSSLALAAAGPNWGRGLISMLLLLFLGLPAAAASGKLGAWQGKRQG